MAFEDDLRRFALKVRALNTEVFAGIVADVHQSIQNGSSVTGAPGQPVDTGFLRASWQVAFESPTVAIVGTNVAYAPAIEYATRAKYDPSGVTNRFGVTGGQIGPALPAGLARKHVKSTRGGNHSVALTRAGFPRIVADVLARVARG